MGAGKSDVKVILTSPSNQEYPCRIEENDSKYFAKIITSEIGEWSARVFYDHAELKESPFKFQALDLTKALISGEKLHKHVHQPNQQINFQGRITFKSFSNINSFSIFFFIYQWIYHSVDQEN
jgi:hypothetical protein